MRGEETKGEERTDETRREEERGIRNKLIPTVNPLRVTVIKDRVLQLQTSLCDCWAQINKDKLQGYRWDFVWLICDTGPKQIKSIWSALIESWTLVVQWQLQLQSVSVCLSVPQRTSNLPLFSPSLWVVKLHWTGRLKLIWFLEEQSISVLHTEGTTADTQAKVARIRFLSGARVWSEFKRRPDGITGKETVNESVDFFPGEVLCLSCSRLLTFLSVTLTTDAPHTYRLTLTDSLGGRRITHRLMRWNKSDPTYQRSQAVFSQNISSFSRLELSQFLVGADVFSCLSKAEARFIFGVAVCHLGSWGVGWGGGCSYVPQNPHVTQVLWGAWGVDTSRGFICFNICEHNRCGQ